LGLIRRPEKSINDQTKGLFCNDFDAAAFGQGEIGKIDRAAGSGEGIALIASSIRVGGEIRLKGRRWMMVPPLRKKATAKRAGAGKAGKEKVNNPRNLLRS
jgi:hypothetical protein